MEAVYIEAAVMCAIGIGMYLWEKHSRRSANA